MAMQAWVRVNGEWRGPGGQTPPVQEPTGLSTVAVIGDSHVYQGGLGESRFRTGLEAAGWAAGDIYWNGVNGRHIQWTDSTGSTTMAQIDAARLALSSEPLWVFILGSNGTSESDSVTDGQIDTVLAKCGAGSRVLWMNVVSEAWPDADRVRRNARIAAAIDRHPELTMTVLDWASYCQTLPTENLWNPDGLHHTGSGYELKNAWTIQQLTNLGYPGNGGGGATEPGDGAPAGWKTLYTTTFAADDGLWTARQETQANDNSYNTPDNIVHSPEGLKILGKREELGGRPFTTGDYTGTGVVVPNYFRAEVTATLPIEPGMWPAPLWFRPLNSPHGEIDVCETWPFDWPNRGGPELSVALHRDYSISPRHVNAQLKYDMLPNPDPAAPHTYTVIKTQNRIEFLCDGVRVYCYEGSTTWDPVQRIGALPDWYATYFEVPERTWYPRATLQIGGDGNVDPDSSWQASEVVIHSLKIYEQDDGQ